ncbi:MAG: DUF5107 domain-containing protein [Fimbriimonadaceae bacterium]|nr:DUF5107 domain-containing protein [Fimbriimonadaceae bacterium]
MVRPTPPQPFQPGTAVAWQTTITIPTYEPGEPEAFPVFIPNRVYQGSSGKVYPLRVIEKISPEPTPREYTALCLENDFLFVLVLPEIGGRIHVVTDKISGEEIFYRQDTIKPALVGLAGPWISGGVEFNWPQHHRPSTFMPCEWTIEAGKDGSVVVWLSEHEPMNRMKGMHGVCLKPCSSVLEVKARIYNRTPLTQTFLWWANVAARVHSHYQSFFPPDAVIVADHARRATSAFPAAQGHYYGVDYGKRAREGVPAAEYPRKFHPPEGLAPNRLDWYVNIPVPTSYMVAKTNFAFFGGYDHASEVGFVHVADPHVSPGKKQWTWGNHEFGYLWDQNLSDDAGPYVELMAGVFTDNQPDFAYLAPYETKTFSHFWWPIRNTGPVSNATELIAVAWRESRILVNVSEDLGELLLVCLGGGEEVSREAFRLKPDSVFQTEVPEEAEEIVIRDEKGALLIRLEKNPPPCHEVTSAQEPKAPEEIRSQDELYWIGTHLEQYRHATRAPEPYWREALRRDPSDSRCHLALAQRLMRKGLWEEALHHLVQSEVSQTKYNGNPPSGLVYWLKGICFERRGETHLAEKAYGKALWNADTKGPAAWSLARLACQSQNYPEAIRLARESLLVMADHNNAHCLLATLARLSGSEEEGKSIAASVLAKDPLCHWALRESGDTLLYQKAMRNDPQNTLDLALDYLSCGLSQEAIQVLKSELGSGTSQMVSFALEALGEEIYEMPSTDLVFPSRWEELEWLQELCEADATGQAAYLLGNMLYDRGRTGEANSAWELSLGKNPDQPIVLRNLAVLAFNVMRDGGRAVKLMDKALDLAPDDARLVMERHLLAKEMGEDPQFRRDLLEKHKAVVPLRDDLRLEYVALVNLAGEPELAMEWMRGHIFRPWEGGEGQALGQFTRSCQLLARKRSGDQRVATLLLALEPPESLGEARHLLANASDLWLEVGDAFHEIGEDSRAREFWLRAAEFKGDFQEMEVRAFSEMTYFSVLALRRLGRHEESQKLAEGLLAFALDLADQLPKTDYFATSLPTFLTFEQDALKYHRARAALLRGQARALLGQSYEALVDIDYVIDQRPEVALARDLRQSLRALT